jgi:uncharacterized membrane protein YidH (DUF202 family)
MTRLAGGSVRVAAPVEVTIWDSGLQSERTGLAWARTAAALAVGGLAAAGSAIKAGVPVVAVIGFCVAALCGSALLIRAGVRYRRVQRALHAGHPLDDRADALIAWIGTIAATCSGLAVVLLLA